MPRVIWRESAQRALDDALSDTTEDHIDGAVRVLARVLEAAESLSTPPVFGRNVPHPRSYGTFARVLGLDVRDKKLLSLETAVQKMSAFPAQRLGLSGKMTAARPGRVLYGPSLRTRQ